MRVPISWLREYVDVEMTPDQLAERITNAGLEVTSVERIGIAGAPLEWAPTEIVFARLLRVSKHPNADRLVIATVDYGAEDTKDVVTGAPNLFPYLDAESGSDCDLTERVVYGALILEGARYLDPYKDGKPTKLKGKELRGIYNDSMLASAAELGMGDDHDGILLIPEDELPPGGCSVAPGTPLVDVLGDAVLDIDIIPNIARCASILGVAREVAALTRAPLRTPSLQVVQEGPSLEGRIEITTTQPELNPRFVAFLIEGVEQKPAPFWMQHRLRMAGQRPIHVVVDVSNYVMLELGQPNHTFDWDFLRRRADQYAPDGPVQIVTRLAEEGEKLITLDGEERELRENHILVTDPAGNLSLGGIMGGRDSEIEDETTNVLLEAAAWKFTNIRQTQRELGLHTEAGFRFSRGVHPQLAMEGARRAAELLRLLAGGTVAAGHVDTISQPWHPVEVTLDPTYVNERSGLSLVSTDIADHLRRLEFRVDQEADGKLRVVVPEHRIDVEGPHDLLEEVCRMVGYENLPSTLLDTRLPNQRGNPSLEFEETARDLLARCGLHEVISYRLTTREREQQLGDPAISQGPWVELANPSTVERSVLRRSLLASMLDCAANNLRFTDRLALFEVGQVFLPEADQVLPREETRISLLLCGPRDEGHFSSGGVSEDFDFFDLKGVVEVLLGATGRSAHFAASEQASLRPGRTAEVQLQRDGASVTVGHLGELHPMVAQNWGIATKAPLLVADLDASALFENRSTEHVVHPTPIYPAVREDLAFVVSNATPAHDLETVLRQAGGALLEDIELFDLYRGDKIPAESKSLAYRLTYRSPKKTLSDKDATKLRKKLVRAAEQELGATLRE